MKPEIFMDDFERTEWGDSIYSAIGRALTFATHFEAGCRGLAAILQLKTPSGGTLRTQEDLNAFSEQIHRRTLNRHITYFARNQDELRQILDRARVARNEIAHEIALGIDSPEGLDRSQEYLATRLRGLSISLAEADRLVCLLLSVLTHEPVPTSGFLKEYPDRVSRWICDLELE